MRHHLNLNETKSKKCVTTSPFSQENLTIYFYIIIIFRKNIGFQAPKKRKKSSLAAGGQRPPHSGRRAKLKEAEAPKETPPAPKERCYGAHRVRVSAWAFFFLFLVGRCALVSLVWGETRMGLEMSRK